MQKTIRQVQRFYVMYAPKQSFVTIVGGQWHRYSDRPFTYMEACEKTAALEGQFGNYRFKVLHEKLLNGKKN